MPQDPDRPTSNPLLPQSEAFSDFKNSSMISAQELLENVAQQVPNFGTEQVCFLTTVLVSISPLLYLFYVIVIVVLVISFYFLKPCSITAPASHSSRI